MTDYSELVNRLRKPEHSIRAPLDDTRAIATPPQENALQELADLGQEFDAAPTRWIRLEPPQSGEGE